METIVVKINNTKDAMLFKNLIKNLSFIKSFKVIDKSSIPVIWAKKYNPNALFNTAGENKLVLKSIRKSWQRTK